MRKLDKFVILFYQNVLWVIENNLGDLWRTKNLQYANEIFDQKCFLSIFQPKILNWLQKRSLVNLGFEMCSFFSIILFFFYILLFSCFKFFLFFDNVNNKSFVRREKHIYKKTNLKWFLPKPSVQAFYTSGINHIKKKI